MIIASGRFKGWEIGALMRRRAEMLEELNRNENRLSETTISEITGLPTTTVTGNRKRELGSINETLRAQIEVVDKELEKFGIRPVYPVPRHQTFCRLRRWTSRQ